jgi:hypothetical protein
MNADSNDPEPGSSGHRRDVYDDLRRHNERRMDLARVLEARRIRQIERVMQTARDSRFREPPK